MRGEPSRMRALGVLFTSSVRVRSGIQKLLNERKRVRCDHPWEVRRRFHVAAIHSPEQRRKPLGVGMVHVRMTVDEQRGHIITSVEKSEFQGVFAVTANRIDIRPLLNKKARGLEIIFSRRKHERRHPAAREFFDGLIGLPLSDTDGFRRDVLDAARKLNVTLLRWPGGNFSSNYHWMDGIGPRDQRPPRLEMAWGTVETNRFGTHEFLNYVEKVGRRALRLRELGNRHLERSAAVGGVLQLIRRHRHDAPRKQNGRAGAVEESTYWGLGNEMDGPWQMGHRSAEDYGKFALEAAKLMKWTDPNIKLIAAGSSNFGAGSDWTGWNRTVLEFLKQHADYLSLHTYVGNPNNDFRRFHGELGGAATSALKTAEGIIDAALSGQPGNRKIYIAWDEWNVWYRARGDAQRGRRILEEHYNLEDALVVATFLNSFVNHAHIVKIANMAQLVNVIAPIFTNEKGLFLQTIYYPLQLFANNTRGKALELFVDSPKYSSRGSTTFPTSMLRRATTMVRWC